VAIDFTAALDAGAAKWATLSAAQGTTPLKLELRIKPEGLVKGVTLRPSRWPPVALAPRPFECRFR